MPTGSSPARLLWRPPGKGSFRERVKHSIRSWRFIIYPFLFEANGHGIFPVAVGDFLEKAAHPRRSIVGARHALPAGLQCLSGKFDAKARRDREKPSPGGWCSAQRIQNLYDCQWQSYLYYGVTPFGVTDEVEGNSVVPTYGDNRQLRPHQSQLTLRQLPLQGKPFAPLFLRMKFERAGHAAAPTLRNDTASRPSSVCPAGSRLPTKPAQGSFALGG